MTEFILTIHLAIVVALTIRILLRDDLSPSTRLAWFILLTVLPFIGGLIYFLFGKIDLGNHANKRYKATFVAIRSNAANLMGAESNTDQMIDPVYRAAFKCAGSINGFHTMSGNRTQLMAGAAETNAHLVEDIDNAQSHVHVLYYIWLTDGTGTDVAHALIRAAKRGVTCRAMADGLGSRALIKSPLWQQMKAAGVELAIALPLNKPIRTLLTSRIDLRNHRKITVVDSKITYCGSRNSADPEFLVKAKYAPWVDIMLRFEGPIVAQNELLFLSDWLQATNESLDDLLPMSPPVREGFAAQVTGDGPTERKGATPQLFASLMNCA